MKEYGDKVAAELEEMTSEEQGKRTYVRRNIPAEEFVTAWKNSSSLDEVINSLVAKGYDTNKKHVGSFAMQLRKKGVKLKQMKRGGKPMSLSSEDIEKLNNLLLT